MNISRLFSFLIACFVAGSATMMAQLAPGDWKIHNNYAGVVQKVIDSRHLVTVSSDGNLFTYDKRTGELFGHNTINGLSDINVTNIFRNDERGFVLVCYASGNIDILYDDGRVINLSDIADATQVSDKDINDVAFHGSRAYVATAFGLVVFDLDRGVVEESGLFSEPVTAVTVIDGRLLIALGKTLLHAPLEGRHNTLDRFTPMENKASVNIVSMEPVSDSQFLFAGSNGAAYNASINLANNTWSERGLLMWLCRFVQPVPGGAMAVNTSTIMFVYPSGSVTKKIPEGMAESTNTSSFRAHSVDNDGSYWYINHSGIGRINAEGIAEGGAGHPAGTSLQGGVWMIHRGAASGNLYLANRAGSRVPYLKIESRRMGLNTMSNGHITDITPAAEVVKIENSNSGGLLRPPFPIVEDPVDPGALYVSTWFEGIYRFKDGAMTEKFNGENTPLSVNYIHAFPGLNIDSEGNLWVYGFNNDNPATMFIGYLPAAKRRAGSVKASDWVKVDVSGFGNNSTRNVTILPLTKGSARGTVLISEGWDPRGMLAWRTSDGRHALHTSFTDQDGLTFGPEIIYSMAEDHNGAVWFGTTDGVIVSHDPANLVDPSATIERVKVPRNDGTNYADYLLGNRTVTAIAVDHANRKWLGTSGAGLYLVSDNGREIIEHFTAANSPLISDEITALHCDPDNNTLYIGTRYGLMEFGTDASPAAENYSDIYAYPNPVRPDYVGPITITGLMDGSLVKIADVSGNVFYQAKATGGMAQWDGTDATGRRVKTGVYLVFASTGGEMMETKGAVAKIMVVN